MLKILKRYSTYTLLVALLISAISAYYSIVGLTAIFAAAVVPIIVMGAALELGKLVAAVWLKLNWSRAPLTYKLYLVPAVAFLMALTSMGIFGFLSKAHSDQSLVSGDSMAKVAIYDEKIKTSKDNIEANRKALKQMDEAVDQQMARSTDENGAAKSVAIRRSQQKERTRLQSEIAEEQKTIAKLNEEAAPLRAEFRKVEAEVGPIKYIAALIYDDAASEGVLEKAVRFVIIMIVAVFDPLALVLILAAQQSMRWEREEEEKEIQQEMDDVKEWFKRGRENAKQLDEEAAALAASVTNTVEEPANEPISEPDKEHDKVEEENVFEKHPYLLEPFTHFKGLEPMVATQPVEDKEAPQVDEFDETRAQVEDNGILALGVDVVERPGDYLTDSADHEPVETETFDSEAKPDVDLIQKWDQELQEEIQKLNVTADAMIPVSEVKADIVTQNVTREIPLFDPQVTSHVTYDGKYTSLDSLRMTNPDVVLKPGERIPNTFKYGTSFPTEAYSGDLYMRVDNRPHRLFKFNGGEWIHVNKNMNTSYLQDESYVQMLIDALNDNQYLPEMLTEAEDEEIRNYLDKE